MGKFKWFSREEQKEVLNESGRGILRYPDRKVYVLIY